MLTVKFLKYIRSGANVPVGIEHTVIYPAKVVRVEESDVHGRQVVRIENGAPFEQKIFTVGGVDRDDVMFNKAYVMNENGKTVETVR